MSVFKTMLSVTTRALLGRRTMARLGQFIANEARLDRLNDFATNGELLVQKCVAQLARQEKSCILLDVGANVGLWSRHFVQQLHAGGVPFTIYAFEPFPDTFATLTQNLQDWNLADKVQGCNVALSAKTGEQTFYALGPNQGRNSLYPFQGETSLTTTVPCSTLDQWCTEQGIVSVWFLKIDTEGHDLEVLQGAKRLLEQGGIEMLQFEYNHCWIAARRFLLDAFELLTPLGYRLGKITGEGIEFYEQWDHELESFREGNYLAVKAKYVSAFPAVTWWKA